MSDEEKLKHIRVAELSEKEKERLAELVAEKIREEMMIERDRCGFSA